MKLILTILVLSSLIVPVGAQAFNSYEVEILQTRGKKDTREVNSILKFEAESVKVVSRRNSEVFKEFKYTDIKTAEHTNSAKPFTTSDVVLAVISPLLAAPALFRREKNWLTVSTDNDFAVLKLENDNYRQILAEFRIRKIRPETITPDNSKKEKTPETKTN